MKKLSVINRGYGQFPLDKKLWIYASVLEGASGIRQSTKDTSVTFSSSRYRIECDMINNHYQPGLPITGSVRGN